MIKREHERTERLKEQRENATFEKRARESWFFAADPAEMVADGEAEPTADLLGELEGCCHHRRGLGARLSMGFVLLLLPPECSLLLWLIKGGKSMREGENQTI
ncbi:hypothetical protein QOT17_006358 [Balamuthia mandrillaris]